jgi:putative restriction endonuclease
VLSTALEARLATIPETDRTREVRQRIGQDLFREALMELWEGRCALSGHAKPWALSSDDERLDPFNGLLLAVHYDALFDQGLIAFANDGTVLLASGVTSEVFDLMGLEGLCRLSKVLPGQLTYLEYHRTRIFKR